MKKIKPVVVEYKYIGNMTFPSWKDWHRYKAYRDTATAEAAMDNLRRKYSIGSSACARRRKR